MNNIQKVLLLISLLVVVSAGVIAVISSSEDTPPVVDTQAVNAQASSGPTITDLSKGTGHVVNRLDSCADEKYVEQTPIIDNCSYNSSECNSDNTSCVLIPKTYPCITGYDAVEKTNRKCKTDGYKIGKNKLNTQDYVCNVDDTADATTVICDSKYDGNGDGVCTSGESCMKFIVTGNGMDVYKKNSKDEFVKDDPTFFLNEITSEVEE